MYHHLRSERAPSLLVGHEADGGATPLMSINDEVLEDLLHCFDSVFATPVGLPPVRPRSHQNRLLLGTTPVVVRPYHYAHPQKESWSRSVPTCFTRG
jgi:hypothetical protein